MYILAQKKAGKNSWHMMEFVPEDIKSTVFFSHEGYDSPLLKMLRIRWKNHRKKSDSWEPPGEGSSAFSEEARPEMFKRYNAMRKSSTTKQLQNLAQSKGEYCPSKWCPQAFRSSRDATLVSQILGSNGELIPVRGPTATAKGKTKGKAKGKASTEEKGEAKTNTKAKANAKANAKAKVKASKKKKGKSKDKPKAKTTAKAMRQKAKAKRKAARKKALKKVEESEDDRKAKAAANQERSAGLRTEWNNKNKERLGAMVEERLTRVAKDKAETRAQGKSDTDEGVNEHLRAGFENLMAGSAAPCSSLSAEEIKSQVERLTDEQRKRTQEIAEEATGTGKLPVLVDYEVIK
jgi:hypothetical protein